ncbi:MAG: hypothetical protein Q4F88_03780 [Eubacteriales bacterium]|nr:hypothetical protein [Eubacteriales bacterium]
MIKQRIFPWAMVQGPKYEAKEKKPRKRWVNIGGWVFTFLFLLIGILRSNLYMILFGILLIFAMFYKATSVVSERGIETFHDLKLFTKSDRIMWEDVNSIVIEYDKKNKNLTRMHFGYGSTEIALYFTKEEALQIQKMAKKYNYSIKIMDAITKK